MAAAFEYLAIDIFLVDEVRFHAQPDLFEIRDHLLRIRKGAGPVITPVHHKDF